MTPTNPGGKLVVGCGYLGRRAALAWLRQGARVWAVTRSAERATSLAEEGLLPHVADVTDRKSLDGLPPVPTVLFAVAHDPHSGKSREEVHLDGLRNLMDAVLPASPRLLFISTTGVYGQTGGDWVDEDSPCQPRHPGGHVYIQAEQLIHGHPIGERAVILRLGGIYGPGRIPRLADLESGLPLPADPLGHLNLIHVDDAVRVLLAVDSREPVPSVLNVTDGHPVLRREFYEEAARLAGLPGPAFVPRDSGDLPARRGETDKRVRSDRLLGTLGIELEHPSFRHGLRASGVTRRIGAEEAAS